MLRSRDIAAVFLALVLTRMAWNDNLESLSATIHLAFYLPRHDAKLGTLGTKPALFDVDGDGTTEALAVISGNADSSAWRVQILDLKPAMQTDKTHVAPFRPKPLFESPLFAMGTATPISLVTGQVLLTSPAISQAEAVLQEQKEPSLDRTRHYFCGLDWHDASTKCSTHCAGGLASDCPEGERCFADTPCDVHAKNQVMDKLAETLHLTPGGGLPSVFVLWSNGAVSMHSLTGDLESGEDVKKSKSKAPSLELRSMWQAEALAGRNATNLEALNLQFFDALSSGDQSKSGMIIVSAVVTFDMSGQDDDDAGMTSYYVLAMDAKNGETVWESLTQDELDALSQKDLPLPMARGTSSNARRRSLIPNLHPSSLKSNGHLIADCMHAYRRSLMTSDTFPFTYHSEEDATVQALHFDLHQQSAAKTPISGSKNKLKAAKKAIPTKPHSASGGKPKSWSSSLIPGRKHKKHHKAAQAKFGRPNVLVSHHERGLEVRSLKNGRSLCHLSLWEHVLYADLDHDGVLDSVEVIAGNREIEDEEDTDDAERWVTRLVKRVAEKNKESSEKENISQRLQKTPLCHVLALSGLPIKEELFSASLCGTKRDHEDAHPSIDMIEAPPLAVESLQGKKGWDVIVAVNTGSVHRFQGSSGRRQWELAGKHYEDFPTWSDESNVVLSRIGSENVIPSTRPILLAGENSLAILSARRGSVLASASFPQPSVRRPVLADVNGDGTTDVLIMTTDAVWGYHVVVRTGASIVLRIMTGLLLMGMMLAVLRNRFGPHPGKRSTDA
jgi:hypothetical protein